MFNKYHIYRDEDLGRYLRNSIEDLTAWTNQLGMDFIFKVRNSSLSGAYLKVRGERGFAQYPPPIYVIKRNGGNLERKDHIFLIFSPFYVFYPLFTLFQIMRG